MNTPKLKLWIPTTGNIYQSYPRSTFFLSNSKNDTLPVDEQEPIHKRHPKFKKGLKLIK